MQRGHPWSETCRCSQSFKKQYLHQPVAGANHALWVVGHLAFADDLFLGAFDVRPHKLPADWHTGLFGQGSVPSAEAPPVSTTPDGPLKWLSSSPQTAASPNLITTSP